jgi:hypothetical protein
LQHPVTFSDGASGFACGYDGAVLALICERAHPPGRPLELSLRVEGAELPLTLRGKSAGSKRRDDQRFDVRLRLHSLRREQRQQLEQLFAPG